MAININILFILFLKQLPSFLLFGNELGAGLLNIRSWVTGNIYLACLVGDELSRSYSID